MNSDVGQNLLAELNAGRVPNWLRTLGYNMLAPDGERDPDDPEWFWMSLVAKALRLSNFAPIFPCSVQIHGWGVMSVLNLKTLLGYVTAFVTQNLELTARSQMPDVCYLSPAFQKLLAMWLRNNHPITASQVEVYIRWLAEERNYVIDMHL
jgi:hypothetical protein